MKKKPTSSKSINEILQQEYLTSKDVEKGYNYSAEILEHHAQKGRVPYLKVKRKFVFSRFAIEKFLSTEDIS